MPKIEKWRVEELSLLLDFLAALLRQGKNPEWANVFSHFDQEARLIISAEMIATAPVKRLVRDIKNCYGAGCTFAGLVLESEESRTKKALNLEFGRARARLWGALLEIEKRMVEFVN
jgi:hypothetical protein